jgi:hypothetical protein
MNPLNIPDFVNPMNQAHIDLTLTMLARYKNSAHRGHYLKFDPAFHNFSFYQA